MWGRKVKKIAVPLALFLSSTVHASEVQDKQQVFNIIKEYANVASCMHSFDPKSSGDKTTMKDVITVERDEHSLVYYVFWSGDLGCSAGSGTISSFVTEVAKYGLWKPFTVQTDYAFGDDIGINYRFIESLKMINKNHFEVVAWNYADSKYGGSDGGNNFPANKFKYTIQRENFEPWKVTNQTLLEQNK